MPLTHDQKQARRRQLRPLLDKIKLTMPQAALLLRAVEHQDGQLKKQLHDRAESLEALWKLGYTAEGNLLSDEQVEEHHEQIKAHARKARECLPDEWRLAHRQLEEAAELYGRIKHRVTRVTARGREAATVLTAAGYTANELRYDLYVGK